MRRHARRIFSPFFAVLVVLVLFPLAAAAQTGDDGSSLGKTVPDLSTQASDEMFRAVIKARDDKLTFVAELKQIKSYHDKFKSGLDNLLLSLPMSYHQVYSGIIGDELVRLKQFEDDINNAVDDKTKDDLAKTFSGGYPVVLNENKVVRFVQETPENNPLEFARRELANAGDVFKNVGSFENRLFLDDYQKVFSTMQSFGITNESVPLSGNLPGEFDQLAGAISYVGLTGPQIKSAIGKYRDALLRTRDFIAASTTFGQTFRTSVMKQVDTLDQKLRKQSDDLNSQMNGLEKDMALTAKSLYGKTVGADSFNYLLIVFLLVFAVIMIMPKFYPAPVAENVLKSEFLLQLSTVFVLVAAIIILSIGGFIERNQLPVLLAGISGYVLGQLGSNSGGGAVRASAAPPLPGAPITPPLPGAQITPPRV